MDELKLVIRCSIEPPDFFDKLRAEIADVERLARAPVGGELKINFDPINIPTPNDPGGDGYPEGALL